jgi:hypothetical protein
MDGFAVLPDVCNHLKPVFEGSGPYSERDFKVQVPWELASGSGISIRAEDAWKISRGSHNVTIAIIDEGFDVRRLPPGSEVEVLSASKCAASLTGFSNAPHGARLSELIVGSKEGYPGVAPGCRLLLIELPSFCTETEEAYAFDLAFQFDAAAVCCAWGPAYRGPNASRPMPASVSASIARLTREGRGGTGAMVFFAAGNQGCDIGFDGYASHAMVTAIGGVTRRGCSLRSMDFGDKIEIAAPVSSPDGVIGGRPGLPPGASGAAALVTGVAGLIFSVNPGLRASQVYEILKRTSVVPRVDYSTGNLTRQPGVVDAGKAVLDANQAIPLKERFPNKTIFATPRLASKIERREFRERRYNGGEHSYFGLTAAYMLQQLYQRAGNPQAAFYGPLFSAYTPTGPTPTYQSTVQTIIDGFFANNSSTGWDVPSIPNYPSLPNPWMIPFGYLVGLAADIYGTPFDLLSAFLTLGAMGNNFSHFVSYFQKEILSNFQNDDDLQIFLTSAPDSFANYINLAKKNYSHFVGHNFLFYLSYHLLAVNDAIKCAGATSQADVTTFFNNALAEEACALHFLTDMFSSGHARDPRWAFLYGNLSFGSTESPHKLSKSDAHLISRLIHDYEGRLGCLVMNATASTTTERYFWKIYGDGSLNLDQLDQPDNLIYFNNTRDTIANALISSEPIQWGAYMPTVRSATDNLRRLDLITGLMCVSIADIFRHMAQNVALATSAQGATAESTGLLGYVLERIPFALPIKSGLQDLSISDPLRDVLMATLYTSGATSGPDYATTELNARLMDYAPLFATYRNINLVLASYKYTWSLQDFSTKYCAGKFDASASTTSTVFEKSWVISQVTNLQTAFGASGNSGLSSVVPSILAGTADFASTVVGSYKPDAITLPAEWINAIPANLTKAILTSPNGVWGIAP